MVKCYKDENGYPRAMADDEQNEVVAAFLEQDIQGSISMVEELLRVLDQVKNGQLKNWEGTGNAHTVVITPEAVVFENEFEDGLRSTISPNEFEMALRSWQMVLTK